MAVFDKTESLNACRHILNMADAPQSARDPRVGASYPCEPARYFIIACVRACVCVCVCVYLCVCAFVCFSVAQCACVCVNIYETIGRTQRAYKGETVKLCKHSSTLCNTLFNVLHRHCNTLCDTLQHVATHCNTHCNAHYNTQG